MSEVIKTYTTEDHPKEMKKLLSHIDDDVLVMLSELGCWVAGGAVTSMFTNKEVNDIDVYFPNKKAFTTAMRECFYEGYSWDDKQEYENKYDVGHFSAMITVVTNKSVLLLINGVKVQFVVHKFYDSVDEIFQDFDFTVCQGALNLKTREWTFHEDFLKHCAQRHIQFNPGTAYPIISALRVHKYKEKGFTISKAQFLKIMLAINAKLINNWETFLAEMSGLYGTPPDKVFDTSRVFDLAEAISQLDNVVISDKMQAQSWGSFKEFVRLLPHAFTEEEKLKAGIQAEEQKLDTAEVHALGLNSRLNW